MKSNLRADWSYPTRVLFGAGRIAALSGACRAHGIVRPLLVTDRGLAMLPIFDAALEQCRAAGLAVEVYTEVDPNPTETNVADGVAAYRSGGHDGVVALGGGSALDCGKCIAFMQGQRRSIWDFEDVDDWWTRADAEGIAPVIAVPTTAGTGSEVGRAGVIINEATRTKKIIFHPKMMPVLVISDPELTVGLPPLLTAGAGMDALAHCLEAYCAGLFHPMSDGVALEGLRLIKDALPRAVADGDDLEARSMMLAAATMGAVAFQKGLGAVHSLSHPVGALYNTHHGLTNGVFMPYVLAYNREIIEPRLRRLCAYLNIDGGFDGLMAWLLRLRDQIGVPHTIGGLGVDGTQVDLVAEMAVQDPTAASNPRPLTIESARQIFNAALSGNVV